MSERDQKKKLTRGSSLLSKKAAYVLLSIFKTVNNLFIWEKTKKFLF